MSSMIFDKEKVVFVHINKAGGSTVEKILSPFEKQRFVKRVYRGLVRRTNFGNKKRGMNFLGVDLLPPHASASEILRVLGQKKFQEYFKFAIVRNPWDLEVSRYEFCRQNYKHTNHDIAKNRSFKEFLLWRKNNGAQSHQVPRISDEEGKMLVNRILKVEELDRQLPGILEEKFGIEGRSVPKENSTLRSHYRDYYDEESKKMVESINYLDVTLLGYTF